MWKRLFLVIVFLSVPVLSNFSPSHVIERILTRLGVALDYMSQHYEKSNVDCLFGIVLAGAVLDDTITETGPYQAQVKALKNKTSAIYSKTLPLMQKQPNWNLFSKYIVVPDLWPKPLKYKLAQFRMAYAKKSLVEALFSRKTYQTYYNYSEGLTDSCLSSVVNSTLKMKPQTICRWSSECEKFVENLEKGAGYMLTHRLLLLQVARARKCKMHPKILATAIKTICTTIYLETISVEYYMDLNEIFDLFLEQTFLCGYEGYADFLKIKWLEKILKNQHGSGCFPGLIKRRGKRDANLWKDGCVDHTTGLGIAVLSLYLNYVLKNGDTIALNFEWL